MIRHNENKKSMQINYIILAHNQPKQLYRLVKRLFAKNVRFYIHIDLKSDPESFLSLLPATNQIVFVADRVNCIWGDISVVNATLNCIKQIVAENRNGYSVLLSGQDYPIKSNFYIKEYLNKDDRKNFINLFSLPSKNWSDEREGMNRVEYYKLNISDRRFDLQIIPPISDAKLLKYVIEKQPNSVVEKINENLEVIMKPRMQPDYIDRFYGGSQWWAFPIETLHSILNYIEIHPDYLDFFKYSFAPDELFFHTIIGNIPELSGNIKETITYVDWESKGPFRPAIFNIADYEKLMSRDELFARKFDIHLDVSILDKIDELTITD